jgi:hypothetical protein
MFRGENKMLRIPFTTGLVIATTVFGPALAQSNSNLPACYSDRVSNAGGLMVRMGSGQLFQGYPGSGGKLASWLPLDKVKICPLGGSAYQITDLNNNKQINALKQ